MFSRFLNSRKRAFGQLNEAEVLALAISSEEDDSKIYRSFAQNLRQDFPDTASMFDEMADEEDLHRRSLIEMFQKKFGEHIPLLRREHVSGFISQQPEWLIKTIGVEKARAQAAQMEAGAYRFYIAAAKQCNDASIRKLLGDLAHAEAGHIKRASDIQANNLTDDVVDQENAKEKREFVLTYVQPGLAGLMDGSVSTLAPIFATAFATQDPWTTFLVGIAASIGAGISMGFTEVASDDGVISGRGSPIKRGLATGIMTTVGGLGHALPYLIPDFWIATYLAIAIVFVELWVISWIQHRFMQTPWAKAIFQVVLGGALVFAAGVLIGGG